LSEAIAVKLLSNDVTLSPEGADELDDELAEGDDVVVFPSLLQAAAVSASTQTAITPHHALR
jgi:hypothetical protein